MVGMWPRVNRSAASARMFCATPESGCCASPPASASGFAGHTWIRSGRAKRFLLSTGHTGETPTIEVCSRQVHELEQAVLRRSGRVGCLHCLVVFESFYLWHGTRHYYHSSIRGFADAMRSTYLWHEKLPWDRQSNGRLTREDWTVSIHPSSHLCRYPVLRLGWHRGTSL